MLFNYNQDDIFSHISNYNFGSKIVIPKHTIFYRAAESLEYIPTPRYCDDTVKIGVYFSANSPYLAETMSTEYNKDLIIAAYETTEDIEVFNGKYSCLYDSTSLQYMIDNKLPEQFNLRDGESRNISHVDSELGGVYSTVEPTKPYAEVFLTDNQLSKINLIMCYLFTVQQSVNKWGYDKRF